MSNINNPQEGVHKIWKRLQERYGCAETVESSLKAKLADFRNTTFKDRKRLYDLQDILCEIESLKTNPTYQTLFTYYDTSVGVNPIVAKLPPTLQTKWRDRATSYKHSRSVAFPPFSFFVCFISEQATKLNDPGFYFEPDNNNYNVTRDKVKSQTHQKFRVSTNKTEVTAINEPSLKCSNT